ncbi:MAG: GTP-binding protein [Legionellaceae bacterium]|nr:GTP-binding protein [Legionellaceae bacterium]
MKYRHRLLEQKIVKFSKHFPVLMITGARQVGKSTLLKHCLSGAHHITFDPVLDVGNARQDPDLFVDSLVRPVILDEVQFSPEILSTIKRRVDEDGTAGQYYLTGSQNFSMMRHVAESLAGRAAIFSLSNLSISEYASQPTCWLVDFLNDPKNFFLKNSSSLLAACQRSLLEMIWRSMYPGLLEMPNDMVQDSLASYFQTYVERDVRLISDISSLQTFSRFCSLLANLTAQEINYSQLGRELNITPQTARRWVDVLVSSYQWTSIPAFSGNTIKRIHQKPKGYVTDTGMACFLMHIGSVDSLRGHPKLGALFETFVVQDILKQLPFVEGNPAIYHWRAHSGAEVDLLIEVNNLYYPIEIKYKSHPTAKDAKGILAFRKAYPALNIAPGIIIAPSKEIYPVADNCFVVPFDG